MSTTAVASPELASSEPVRPSVGSHERMLAPILSALAEAAHVQVDPERLRDAIRRAVPAPVDPLDWVDELAAHAEGIGLRVVAVRLSPEELVELPPHALPVVVRTQEGGLSALTHTRRGRVALSSESGCAWFDAHALAAMIGAADTSRPIVAAVAEAATPLSGGAHAGDDDHGHHHHGGGASRVFSLITLERDDLASVLVFSVFIGLTSLAVPVAVQALVNTVAFGALIQPLVVLSLAVLACLGASGLLRALQARVVERLQQRLFVRAATEFAHRLPRIQVSALDRVHAPEKVNRFFDVLTAQKALAGLLLDGSLLALQAILGMLLLAFYHPFLLAFDVVLLASILAIIVWFGRRAVATSLDESAAKYELVAWLEDVARSPLAFRLNPEAAALQADALARRYLSARREHFRIVFRQIVGGVTLQAVASAALLAVGGVLVLNGQLAIGQLVAAEIVVTTVVAGIAKLGKHLESYYDLVTALEKVGTVTDLPLERDDALRACTAQGPATLELQGVSFGYAAGTSTLSDVTFRANPGEKLALAGGLGSGKSAIADLVFGLREPSLGAILLDGVDIRELGLGELRRHVALVRDVEIVEGSVFDNVALFRPGVTPADVHAALDAVGLGEPVARLPKGVKTRLASGGGPLSFGQSQRLMLARAIAGRPRLLVLDGALDGLDEESLTDLEQRLQRVCRGRTTLLVLTGFETVTTWCDRAVRLVRGRVDGGAK